MNENESPRSTPLKVQRLEPMVVFYVMWTTIVCLRMGSRRRWAELLILHVGIAVVILITDIAFARSESQGHLLLSNSESKSLEKHPPKSTDGDG